MAFKKRGSRILSGVSMGSSLDSKLRYLEGENPHSSKSRPSGSGERLEQSRVSWKVLKKQFPWLKQLRKHQKKGAEAVVSQNGFAALFAQRTGKTWVAGTVLTIEHETTLDVLLVGPLTNLKSTWEKFLREKLPWYSVHRDLDSYLKHQKDFEKAWGHRDHCILLVNPEQLTPLVKKIRRIKWDRIIWDEAQRLRNRASRSSRDAALLAGSSRKRLALTGTPMDKNPKEMWALMRFIAVHVFGSVWKDFDNHFIEQPKIDLKKKMRPMQRQRMMLAYRIAKQKAPIRKDRLKEYAKLIGPYVKRISKEDAGIEEAKVKLIKFNLDPQEETQYRKLERNMIVKHKGVTIKTPLKITMIGKLQQLTGGHIKDEEGELHRTGTTKRRQLRRAIQRHVKDGEPFVVFCKFVWEVHMVARVLERMNLGKGAKLWGKVKDLKRDLRRTNMLLDFQRGQYNWMVCQQRTGGVGVDLYRARKFFVYSMGHSFIDYDQMLSRGDFLDQDTRAEFFLLAVQSSIDTDIIASVKDKKSITEQFYGRLKQQL